MNGKSDVISPRKNDNMDISNGSFGQEECNCGYLKLQFWIGIMSLWISKMFILTRKN